MKRLSLAQKIGAVSMPRPTRLVPATHPHEHLYTIAEIAAEWRCSEDTVLRLFRSEPGVLKIGGYRIPESVMLRVQERRRIA